MLICDICGKPVSDKRLYRKTSNKGITKTGHKNCIMFYAGVERVNYENDKTGSKCS